MLMFVVIDEFRKVKTSEHYESIDSVGGLKNTEVTNQPSTSGVNQSPTKSASSVGVLVNNKQVNKNLLSILDINLFLLIER